MKMMVFAILLSLATQGLAGTDRCLEAPYDAPTNREQAQLAEIYQAIESVLALVTLVDMTSSQIALKLCFADVLDGAEGYFDPDEFQIVLRSGLADDLLSGILLHEIRHADQFLRGYCPTNDVSMKENARAVFAMEADATAISLLAAWKLKDDGHPEVWNALSTWHSQRDIADRFVLGIHEADDVMVALEGAFEQWYESDVRTAQYYLASCTDYLNRQDDSKILPSYRLLPGDFFEDLCTLPGEVRYTCAEPSRPR